MISSLNNMKTRELYIPKGMQKVISMTGTELYMDTDTSGQAPYKAMGFSGKKAKYDFFFRFRTPESRAEYVNKWEDKLKKVREYKQERKEKRSLPHTLKVGDIMYSSWGYDQTNIDWYQVVKVVSGKMVEIRQINGTRNNDGMPSDQGTTMPIKDSFIENAPVLRKKASSSNSINLTSYANAWLWDGRSKFYSTYA